MTQRLTSDGSARGFPGCRCGCQTDPAIMNILFTITSYPPSTGGAQLLTHLLAQHLGKRHSVKVLSQWDSDRTDWLLGTTLRAPGQDHDYIIDGISVHRIGLSWWDKVRIAPYVPIYYPLMGVALPPIAVCLEKKLYSYAAQADLVHNVRIGREALSYASFQVARQRNIPFVFTPVHHPRWVGWRYHAYIDLYTVADVVLALTNAEKQTLIALGVSEERIFVTGMGPVLAAQANPEAFLHSCHIDGPVVLFLGRHYPYKGYRQLLKSARLVWAKIPDAHFVFIGPAVGRSERCFGAMQDRHIHRLGKVDLQKKTDALAACTLLCVPSTQESFGGVYTEAWSFVKPVIGCNIPAVAEVITDGVDGYLVAQEPAQIAERICQLLLHPTQAQAMGKAGQRKVEAKYTWQRIAERTEQAYQRAGSL
jgi:glycosyltransferase involved in cell wall biosynthesis